MPPKSAEESEPGRRGLEESEMLFVKVILQSSVKTFLSGFGNGWMKYCAIVQFWGGQQNILRVILETWLEFLYTTLYLFIPILCAPERRDHETPVCERRY